MDPAFDNLPIIPHENVADVDCCGCLMVQTREGQADVVCNECGGVIQTVPIGDVEAVMLELVPMPWGHCGALNVFPGRLNTLLYNPGDVLLTISIAELQKFSRIAASVAGHRIQHNYGSEQCGQDWPPTGSQSDSLPTLTAA